MDRGVKCLKVDTEVGKDGASSTLGSLANLPLFDQDLLYVWAAGNHSGHSN